MMGKIKINGKEFKFNEGETIYTVAKRNNIFIPVLCYHSQLRITGSCGICVVEVKINGKSELLNSCSEFAKEGMEVFTDSERVLEKRKDIIKSLILNHPVYCSLCDKNGICLLQDYTLLYGEKLEEYKYEREIKEYKIEPFIKFYPDLCIFCERCNRFWNEELNEGEIILIDKEKKEVRLLKDKDILKGFLNYLIDICPTGAFSENISQIYAKPWDLERIDTYCTFCSLFCEIRLYIKKKTKTRTYEGGRKFLPDRIFDIKYQNKGLIDSVICDNAKFGRDFISNDKILKRAKIEGKWKEIDMDEIVLNLKNKLKKYISEETGIILSLNMGNEEIDSLKDFFVNEKRVKNFLIVPGFFDTSFNLMKTNFKIEDIEDNTFILHTGYDFFNSHPVIGFEILRRLRKFKKVNLFSLSYEKGKIQREANDFLLIDNNTFKILKVLFKKLYKEFGVKKEIEEEFLNSFLFLRKIENLNEDNILKELNFEKGRFSKIVKSIINSKKLVVIYQDFIPFEIQKLCYSFKYIKFPVKILILRMWQNTEYFLNKKFPIIDIYEFKRKVENGMIKFVMIFNVNPFLFIKDEEFLKNIFEKCEIFVFDSFNGTHADLSNNVVPLKTFYEKEVKVMDNFCNIKEIKKVFESERIYLPEMISKLKEKESEEINFEEKIEIDLEKI
ncbi:MAG: 2Fe-2S iron-sulfur cluster-binding protein [candidate division WOR-3 bacterium]